MARATGKMSCLKGYPVSTGLQVLFFSLSLFILIFVLSDEEVQPWEAIMLVAGYALYVAACAVYEGTIVRRLCPRPASAIEAETAPDLETSLVDHSNDYAGSIQEPAEQLLQETPMIDGSMFGLEYGEVHMHGFLFKQSRFYTKIRMSGGKWERR